MVLTLACAGMVSGLMGLFEWWARQDREHWEAQAEAERQTAWRLAGQAGQVAESLEHSVSRLTQG